MGKISYVCVIMLKKLVSIKIFPPISAEHTALFFAHIYSVSAMEISVFSISKRNKDRILKR